MNANRDESERCIEIAEKYILENNRDKAEKFLSKAENLFPSRRAKILLGHVQLMVHKENESAHKYRKPAAPLERPSTAPTPREQYEMVKRVNRSKNYYEILGVNKFAIDLDIRKAYKKLALHLHPDKNRFPGADEAFKSTGNAMAVLTDVEKRKQYDAKLALEMKRLTKSNRQRQNNSYTDLLDIGLPNRGDHTSTFGNRSNNKHWSNFAKRSSQPGKPHNNKLEKTNCNNKINCIFALVVQIVPIFLAILLTMASTYLTSDSAYSLTQTAKYPIQKETSNIGLVYFVSDSINSENAAFADRLEAAVEEEYLNTLRQTCKKEKDYRDSVMWKARNSDNQKMFEAAQELLTPSCEEFNSLIRRVTKVIPVSCA